MALHKAETRVSGCIVSMAVCLAAVLAASSSAAAERAADGLSGKVFVGYQGWFGCPHDFQANQAWQHWFVRDVRPENLTVELLPSVRDIPEKELCETGLPRADGHGTIKLFSAQNPVVVAAHFRWMRDAGIDGAAMQRFVSELSDPTKKARGDHVLQNVRAASEASGRLFYLVYDVSGANAQTAVDDLRKDWSYVVNTLRLTDSPAYLRDHGKPVLELWGFGFTDHPGTPDQVMALLQDLKSGRGGLTAATVVGGVPTYWRTLTGDSQSDAAWASVYRSYDVLSPWSVGRFGDDAGADNFYRGLVGPDRAEAHRVGVRYMPVVSPGFSWSNLQRNRGKTAALNQTPRNCGRFLWRQVADALQSHVDSLYFAMFDEVDEGTALFPAETRADKLPSGTSMVFLNQDGCSLPDDWYLRVTGAAASELREGKLPPAALDAVIRP